MPQSRIRCGPFRIFRTTNPTENLNWLLAHYTRYVKRCKDGRIFFAGLVLP